MLPQDTKVLKYLESLTLLCVEDNKTSQMMYKIIFDKIVKKIIFAQNGQEGLELYYANDIDIVITDYYMPVLNGLEMSREIRKNNQDVPIILVSSIEDVNTIVEALHININNFIKKPILNDEVLNTVLQSTKLLIANRYIQTQRIQELQLLQDKESYNSYQEDLAFAKELNILRNDFYYQMLDDKNISLIDFVYQPLDLISGDAYTARRVDKNRTFYLIVDGMGKGLSASLTAMIMTSFINHIIDKMIEYDSFSLDMLVKESIEYIKPILLEEESVAIDYILINTAFNTLSYAKFAMPLLLMQDRQDNIIKLRSNNPPLCKWQRDYKIDEYNISDIEKFLFYSDGVVENSTKNSVKMYGEYIEQDFKESFTREDLKTKIFNTISDVEDDITLIFINRIDCDKALKFQQSFLTTLEEVDTATEWYSNIFKSLTTNHKISANAELVFTELYMNAYEHGNLAISSEYKHQIIEDDTYFEILREKEKNCKKKIEVKVLTLSYNSSNYVITFIHDEGSGFDTQILSEIFRNGTKFNGRGVFISRKNSLGIYYNSKGNSVLYLNKI